MKIRERNTSFNGSVEEELNENQDDKLEQFKFLNFLKQQLTEDDTMFTDAVKELKRLQETVLEDEGMLNIVEEDLNKKEDVDGIKTKL